MLKGWKIVLAVAGAFIIGVGLLFYLNLPKPLAPDDAAYDLSQLADGTYCGSCDNGIVKAQVEVDVASGVIADVRITEHQNGRGSPAEAVARKVVESQSVEVDAISGATISSNTILKAVENALSGGM